jgi:tRNA(Ile)-lysidine synthase
MNLVGKVEHRINEIKLIQPQDKIVVAVSGGPDSVALLHVLVQLSSIYEWKLLIAHVNHKFRGTESDLEAEFVRELAVSLQLPYEIAEIDVPTYMIQSSLNAQTAAREKRYEFLYQLASLHHAQKIALAHHADDQAETMIMRMIRGTSPTGLVAIPERRTEKKVELIRPFLRIYKTEVEAYCRENHFAFCVDSSNYKKTYFRNQVRLDVLPFLQTFNPQISKSLNQLSEIMLHEDEYMNRQAMEVIKSLVNWHQSNAEFSRKDFLELPIAIQRRAIKAVVQHILQENSILEYEAIERIRVAITQEDKSTKKLDFHKKIAFIREYDKIGFYANLQNSEEYVYVIAPSSTQFLIPEIHMEISVSWKTTDIQHQKIAFAEQEQFEQIAWFDARQICFPLEIRNRKPGDRIEPLGVSGTKKIKDLFIDAKIPPSWREKAPIVTDASGKVVWIPFIRRSKHALIHDETKDVVEIQFITNHPNI